MRRLFPGRVNPVRAATPRGPTASIIACLLFVAGCSGANDPAVVRTPGGGAVVESIQYAAVTEVLETYPILLRTTLELRNRNPVPMQIEFANGCTAWLRAYRSADRRQPVWDHGNVLGCTQAIVMIRLSAGERHVISFKTNSRDILGDSLPDGRYYFTAFLRPNGLAVEVEAGEADLAVPR